MCDGAHTPTVICASTPAHVRFTQIFNSTCFLGLLDDDGEFHFSPHWTGGHTMHIPREIFGGSFVSALAFGDAHVLVATRDNKLFAAGYASSAAISHGRDIEPGIFGEMLNNHRSTHCHYVVREIELQAIGYPGRILGVACAASKSCFWTGDGVWLWGVDVCIFLDTAALANVYKPTRVSHLGGTGCVKQVSMGPKHMGVTRTSAEAFAWGENDCGQLATGDKRPRRTPTKVCHPDLKARGVEKIVAYGEHTTFLTGTGEVWTVGRLCKDSEHILAPLPVACFGGQRVVEIDAHKQYAAAVTRHGVLYTWGRAIGDSQGVMGPPALCNASVVMLHGACARTGPVHSSQKTTGEYLRESRVPRAVFSSWFGYEEVGHWGRWARARALAFAMTAHARLGSKSPARDWVSEILQHISEYAGIV
jgi:alpha-tubulin suppressor-like RCC1 family protein